MTTDVHRVTLPGDSDDAGSATAREVRLVEGLQVVELVLIVALGTWIGTWFEPMFDDLSLLVAGFVVASVCAALDWWLVRGRRWPPTATALVSFAAFVLVATIVVSGVPTPSAMADVVRELAAGPRVILTSPLPVASAGLIGVVPLAVVWAAVWAAVEIDLRTDAAFAPLLPLAVAAVAPATLGGTATVPSTSTLTLVLALGGLLGVLRTLRPRPGSSASSRTASVLRRRRLTIGLPVLAVVALVAPPLTRALGIGDTDRYDPRSVPSGEEIDLRSPLARVDAIANAGKETTAFTATGSPGVERWRLAVLDRYDGVAWTSAAELAPAGSVLPEPARESGRRDVRATVTVAALGTRFVPSPGLPVRVSGVTVRHDASTGTLYAPGGLDPGDRYAVTAVAADPSSSELALASADRTATDAALQRAPSGAIAIGRFTSDEVDQRRNGLSGTPDYRTVRAVQALFADKRRFRLAREPLSGESLRQLGTVLGLQRAGSDDDEAADADGPNQGSRQQLTAAMAVMLRTQGLPTRVVVGYRTPSNTDGRYEVTNREATAWVEVRFDGFGWVPFDAVPTAESETPPTTTTTTPSSTTPSSTSVPTPSSTSVPTPAGADDTGRATNRDGGRSVVALVAVVAAAVTALIAAFVLLRRPIVRGQRRRAADPRRRLRGAWLDVTDRLRRARVPVDRSMTVTEVRDAGRSQVEVEARSHLDDLASLMSVSSWSGREVEPAAADEAWRHADALAGKVHKPPRSADQPVTAGR